MKNYSNTNRMFYNINKHRYILTPDAIEQTYGIQLLDVLDSDGDISPDTLPERFLDRASKMLYTYMYSWAEDHDKTEYVLSLPKNRDGIEEAMEEYVYSLLMNNTDPSVYFTGNSLNAVEVPPNVQTILLNNGLIFRGTYCNLPEGWHDTRGVDY